MIFCIFIFTFIKFDTLIFFLFVEDITEQKLTTEENYIEAEQNVEPISEPMDISSTT